MSVCIHVLCVHGKILFCDCDEESTLQTSGHTHKSSLSLPQQMSKSVDANYPSYTLISHMLGLTPSSVAATHSKFDSTLLQSQSKLFPKLVYHPLPKCHLCCLALSLFYTPHQSVICLAISLFYILYQSVIYVLQYLCSTNFKYPSERSPESLTISSLITVDLSVYIGRKNMYVRRPIIFFRGGHHIS